MNTIRAKVALLLIVSIVSVVVLITVTMIYTFRTPTNVAVDLFARQIIAMAHLAKASSGAEIVAQSHHGVIDDDQTTLLRATTARLGEPLDLIVTHNTTDDRIRTASIPIGPGGWLVVDFDPPSDPELWGWFVLITIGVGSIAVFVASRVSKPLALLESAVASVGPDGVLPSLAERGPAEVRATAAAINVLSARLKRVIESRMRVVAAAGHDFRTPLTRMRLRAEFVADDEERDGWLDDIDELDRIADSAIQLVREETVGAAPEVIRVDELVRSIVDELKEQGLKIDLGESAEVDVEAGRLALSRALRNVFINAATHGTGGVVTVVGGKTARITVSDSGPGIVPDELEKVFEPFFRSDGSRVRTISGAGLGLTISREIFRKMGGDISISNRSSGGLVQVIELPSVSADG